MAHINQYVFFDFEMLCSNHGMSFTDMEAIRLGAVKYNIDTEEITLFDHFIRPERGQPLSNFCKRLTRIQDADLKNANCFKTVFEDFLSWVSGIKRTRFFSWSQSDLLRLKLDARRHNIPPTTIKKIEQRYVDFQAVFTKRVSKTQHSVENALALYNLEFLGDPHNPMYDAYNTLRIYLSFLNEPIESDLIMLKQFIFEHNELQGIANINHFIKKSFKNDLILYLDDLNTIFKMKDARKIMKRTARLVNKYENILINRSQLFDKEILRNIRVLTNFYGELVSSYEEHLSYHSKIIILHEHIYSPIQQLAV